MYTTSPFIYKLVHAICSSLQSSFGAAVDSLASSVDKAAKDVSKDIDKATSDVSKDVDKAVRGVSKDLVNTVGSPLVSSLSKGGCPQEQNPENLINLA